MVDPGLALGFPAATMNLIQQGLLERAFHDGLFPALQFRAEALQEEWDGATGQEIYQTRAGLLAPVTTPTTPGQDPVPQTVSYEQWVAQLNRYTGTIDTHLPTSATAAANLYLRNINQLGLQAGQSLNRIPRNALFKAYLSGHTVTIASGGAGATSIRVASLNGFTDVVVAGSQSRPAPVAPTNPLAVTITGVTGDRNVIGFVADNPADPYGPGTLVLSAALGGAGVAARAAVLSAARPQILRSGGGDSVDALGSSDVLTLQDIINAVSILRDNNVLPHDDGFFHAMLGPLSNAQIFQDSAWKTLHTACPDHITYKEAFLGTQAGTLFSQNTEVPNSRNTGAQTSTGSYAKYAADIGGEVINESNIKVGRVMITGKGCMYERWFDEKKNLVSEAGMSGKVGDFAVMNQGIAIFTEGIRLYLRAPMDRLGDVSAATWSCSTSFPVPSDVGSGGPERYKRAIILEHALGF
jgi:hypothetical protein